MKRLKRAILLMGLLAAGWMGFANYYQLDPSDFKTVMKSIGTELENYLVQEDVPAQEEEKPMADEEEPFVEDIVGETQDVNRPLKMPANPFAAIDRHARNTPSGMEVDIPTLAQYLVAKSGTDLEKARAIYVWLAENISYDDAGYNSGNYSSTSAEGVLANRTSVCDGYGSLYLALGKEVGLDIKKVAGYAKGYGYQNGQILNEPNHAWNIININGDWRVFDATWGTGNGRNVNGKLVSEKEFTDKWFNVSPYEAIFSHYPEDASYAYVSPTISLSDYLDLPYVNQSYFDLVNTNDGDEIYTRILSDNSFSFPKVYQPDTYVKAIDLPLAARLGIGKTYEMELHIPKGVKVALIDAKDNWTYFKNDGGRFSLKYTPKNKGPLKIGVNRKGKKRYDILVEYEVVAGDEVL